MTRKELGVGEALFDYIYEHSSREPDVLVELRAVTADHEWAQMQISPNQGTFMRLLVELIGAKKCIEVGVFTGYSSTAVAMSLPEDGTIVACDISEEWTNVAKSYWDKAGVSSKIDLQLRPAVETLDALLENGEAGTYDFAFIDADKENYEQYYNKCLALLRLGGLIVVDNVLWSGKVVDPEDTRESTVALRAFNDARRQDTRVQVSMIPLADGLSLLRKISN